MSISIILAAGAGTRMMSRKPKVLHNVCGEPLLEYVISASEGAGVKKNVVIVGHGSEEVMESFENRNVIFEEQPIGEDAPYGTGYAVMQAEKHISDEDTVVILCGDTPLLTDKTIEELLDFHKNEKYDGTVLTALLEDASGYGRIIRDKSGNIKKIVEEKDATEEERKINEINSGVYCFNGKLLKKALKDIDDNNAQGEFYITDVVGILREDGYRLGAYIIENPTEIHGINSREQLSFSEKVMRNRINKKHMENGVTLIDPENTYIHRNVEIGMDTIIYPGVNIEGNSKIGEDCVITSGTRIVDTTIYNNVSIDSSLIEESIVRSNTKIGPNAHLRPKSDIGENVKLGNFVEVKNAKIGNNTKASHLAYIGDANVGENVNIGCGVIFANYDGKNKATTNVGDNAFIGSNSNLIAPVEVANWGYIAAGSTIIENVEEGDLSIARAHQVNKKGWVEKKKLRD